MKFTPVLAVVNTVVTLLFIFLLVISVGVAGNNDLFSEFACPLLLLVFVTNIITSWMVIAKGNQGIHAVLWRITLTITILVFVYFIVGSLARNFSGLSYYFR